VDDPPTPVYPILQTHASLALLCVGEYELAIHTRHADAPVTILYVPPGQAEHTLPDTNGWTSENERYPPYWYKYKYRPVYTWSQVTVVHVVLETYPTGFVTCDLHILLP